MSKAEHIVRIPDSHQASSTDILSSVTKQTGETIQAGAQSLNGIQLPYSLLRISGVWPCKVEKQHLGYNCDSWLHALGAHRSLCKWQKDHIMSHQITNTIQLPQQAIPVQSVEKSEVPCWSPQTPWFPQFDSRNFYLSLIPPYLFTSALLGYH